MLPEFKNSIPEYAKDLKLNISSVLDNTNSELTEKQIYGIALASAYATHDGKLVNAVLNSAADRIDESTINAAKAATSIMAMNNIYYRFAHLSEDADYLQMPANLRMNVIANPGVDKIDFELYSIAVSAINGCGLCISSHSKTLVKAGASKKSIQHAIRIASVIHGLAQVTSIERH